MLTRASIVAALVVVTTISSGSAQQLGGFDARFTDKTMRVDYFHSGGKGEEIVALERIVSDGPWPVAARAWWTTPTWASTCSR